MLGTTKQHGSLHENNAIKVLEQMLSRTSFSVLLNPLATTSPNKFIVSAVATEYKEEGKKDKEMGSQKEEPHAKLIYGYSTAFWGGILHVCRS